MGVPPALRAMNNTSELLLEFRPLSEPVAGPEAGKKRLAASSRPYRFEARLCKIAMLSATTDYIGECWSRAARFLKKSLLLYMNLLRIDDEILFR